MKWRLDQGQTEILEEEVVRILREKTPAERIAMGIDCDRTARLVLTARIRDNHPDWNDAQVATDVARRMQRGSV